MHSIYVHIEEMLQPEDMNKLRDELAHIPHVTDVELSSKNPHYMTVEYEGHQNNVPLLIQQQLRERGLHSDITSC